MKILHCITGLSADGAQRMLLRLAEGLMPIGFANVIVNLGEEAPLADRFRAIGASVTSLGMSQLRGLPADLLRLRRLIEGERPDVLQGWMYHANCTLACAALWARWRKVPLFWNIRRGLDDLRERKPSTRAIIRVSRAISRIPEQIIYCTPQSRQQHEDFGFNAYRGTVVGNGFDTEAFAPRRHTRAEVLSRLGIPSDATVIGHIGRWDLAKGHRYLIDAYVQVVRRFPRARLVMVGRGVDRDNAELITMLRTHSLGTQVHLLGERDDVRDLFPGIDIFCSSSVAEGFPNVIAEAMSCGVPCVVTDTGASRELVDGVGRVVLSRSTRDLANGLSDVLALSSEERTAIGDAARARVQAQYSLDAVVREYVKLYCGA